MIKLTAYFLGFYSVLFAAFIYWKLGPTEALSFLLGAALITIILGGFYVALKLMLFKKYVARGILVIVLKYLLLGLMLLGLSKAEWLHPVSFVAGISTLILAILSMTVARRFVTKL